MVRFIGFLDMDIRLRFQYTDGGIERRNSGALMVAMPYADG